MQCAISYLRAHANEMESTARIAVWGISRGDLASCSVLTRRRRIRGDGGWAEHSTRCRMVALLPTRPSAAACRPCSPSHVDFLGARREVPYQYRKARGEVRNAGDRAALILQGTKDPVPLSQRFACWKP